MVTASSVCVKEQDALVKTVLSQSEPSYGALLEPGRTLRLKSSHSFAGGRVTSSGSEPPRSLMNKDHRLCFRILGIFPFNTPRGNRWNVSYDGSTCNYIRLEWDTGWGVLFGDLRGGRAGPFAARPVWPTSFSLSWQGLSWVRLSCLAPFLRPPL